MLLPDFTVIMANCKSESTVSVYNQRRGADMCQHSQQSLLRIVDVCASY
jgi:hypothetical protein